jgi:cellulose synthase/poly-beta-1,6-N-acetylglucosamine synthase-like glycosyltransferase
MLQTLFWILTGTIFYAYFGYTLLLLIISVFSRGKKTVRDKDYCPEVTLLIAAYNEKDILPAKLRNSFELKYPKGKLHHLWITDGSDDGTYEYLKGNKDIQVLHKPLRSGKTAALNRAVQHIKTPFIVFTDANTMLSENTIINLVRWFQDNSIGCVAGEKRISALEKEKAATAGEGLYWGYESFMKKLESDVGSVMGAAGELYAIRTELYASPLEKIILDDFMVSISIAEKGYKIKYDPEAYAVENSSFNIKEELKRKVRIAAGGFQVLFSKLSLLNFFKHFGLSFQYVSHKVFRWLVVPFSLIAILILNIVLILKRGNLEIYSWTFILQVTFYLFALLGSILQNSNLRIKAFFMPFYLIIMNYAMLIGFIRYLQGSQTAAWEKAKRKK